jgi:hypothetical protein
MLKATRCNVGLATTIPGRLADASHAGLINHHHVTVFRLLRHVSPTRAGWAEFSDQVLRGKIGIGWPMAIASWGAFRHRRHMAEAEFSHG